MFSIKIDTNEKVNTEYGMNKIGFTCAKAATTVEVVKPKELNTETQKITPVEPKLTSGSLFEIY